MAVELSDGSVQELCNGTHVEQPIVQLLGYEAVRTKNDANTNYRLVLSDGVHINSYFFLIAQLNDLITKRLVKYGTIFRIDKYRFIDGENCDDHSPRWLIYIQKVTVLIHRGIFGNPEPLINVEKNKKKLINLNLNECPSRVFDSIEQLENQLISINELKKQSTGKCSFVLKLTVIKKDAIIAYNHCRVLNMNMKDSTSIIRVSAFSALSDRMNDIFEENKTYYVTDFRLKNNTYGFELKLQSYSVIIKCTDQIVKTIQSIKLSNFNTLLDNDPNTFCDLIGVCIKVSDIEVCGNSTKYIETPKREIILMDISMKTITLKVWGDNVIKFDIKFDDPPVVLAKQAVLKQFNGVKFFSLVKTSMLLINPDTTEAHNLKDWYKYMVSIGDL